MAIQQFYSKMRKSAEHSVAHATGIAIVWNAAGWEAGSPLDAIAIVKDRMEYYQNSKFSCTENKQTIANLDCAKKALDPTDSIYISFNSKHWNDENGNPAGGVSFTRGITVIWQDGPLGRIGSGERADPNGAFVETLIALIRDYVKASYDCPAAVEYLQKALDVQDTRTKRRKDAGTEGTHEGK